MILRARWLLRPGLPPVASAALVLRGGHVARAGPWAELSRTADPDEPVEDLDGATILPGLVNAHTHLELSDLRGRFDPPERFTDWLRAVAGAVWAGEHQERYDAVRDGAAESLAAGVTTVADISYAGHGTAALVESPIRSVSFLEVYGHSQRVVTKRLASAIEAADAVPADKHHGVGLSPHAPYTAGTLAYQEAVRAAGERDWPLATHLHETRDELDLYRDGSGAFGRLLTRTFLGLRGFEPPGTSPIAHLAAAGVFDRPWLVGHGNYLDETDIRILRDSGNTVAFCPRSNAYFGHADHPYRRLLAAGVPVALGTDSLASAPSLSVLEEVRFLHERDPGLPADALLAMATSAGADALGLRGICGRLAEGESADLVALQPSANAADEEPYAALLEPGAKVAGVWIEGRRKAVRPAP